MQPSTAFVFLTFLPLITESSPFCEEAYAYIEVPENTPVGTLVKQIKCQRRNYDNIELSYGIKSGNTHGKFGINTTNGIGQVYVYQAISFESRTINFQLSIEVVENGPERSSTTFILDVQITGVNDYAPLFLFSPYTVYINEDKQPGSVISNPIPYDFDKGIDGSTTSIILDGDDTFFYMDPGSAKVYLRRRLDYERMADYVLTIQVTDDGLPERRSSTTKLNIHVKDVNDNAPVCTEPYIAETFPESKGDGSVITLLQCMDLDTGNNGRLSYSILEGDYTKFRLQGPYLVLVRAIDVDKEAAVWTLTVMVRDRGDPRLSTFIDVVIYVEGVDDNGPVWAPPQNGRYIIDIEEHSTVGKHVVQVSANDMDTDKRDAVILYYMDDYSSMFTIKPMTGDIFLSQEIDREEESTYTLPVSAVSHNNPLNRIDTTVVINVIDVNDNTPEFSQDVFHFYVRENTAIKSSIAVVEASDKDAGINGEVVQRIIGGNPDSLFDIQQTTGTILLMGNLDFETKVTHTIYVQAVDKGRPSRWSTCTVVVTVLPTNEFEPIFKDMDSIDIAEDVPVGTSVFSVEAIDSDQGVDGDVLYNVESSDGRFIVESRTGIVRVIAALDREAQPQIKLVMLATDQGEMVKKTSSLTVNIHVLDRNDNTPVCEDNFLSTELSPLLHSGGIVLSLNCSDKDAFVNGKLSYVILDGNKNGDFSMSSDGSLIITRSPTSSNYRLEIQVSDNGSPMLETSVLIEIKAGGKPRIKNLPTAVYISEDVAIGSSIYRVITAGISPEIKYRIDNITEDSKKLNSVPPPVKIDKFSGNVYTWRKLDRETVATYLVSVTVTEMISGIESSSILTINIIDVNDNKPQFQEPVYNISIMENIERFMPILRLSAKDSDIMDNSKLDFAIFSGNKGEAFQIDNQGVISTNSNIDREVDELFTLIIIATDRGRPNKLTGSTSVIISIIDHDEYAPEFINIEVDHEINLSENTPLGAKLFSVTARDQDVHRELTFDIDNTSKNRFLIDKASGDIFLLRLLDREEIDLHELVVTANGSDKIVTATVTIFVEDINDNAPVFAKQVYKYEVNETAVQGSVVGKFKATDKDVGNNAKLNFEIKKGNTGGAFGLKQVDSNSVALIIEKWLNLNSINEYLLTIEAIDEGSPKKTATVSIIVQVNPEYKIPTFAIDLEVIHVPENTYIGRIIYDASDMLEGTPIESDSGVLFSIENGNKNELFSINKNTGQLLLSRILNDGDESVFVLVLRVSNIYDTNLRDELTLKVEIDDVNDQTPTFSKDIYMFQINEDEMIGTKVGNISAFDNDKGQNAFLNYELTPSAESDAFQVDIFTGILSLKVQPNYFIFPSHHFHVIAYDHGSPVRTGTASVIIDIIDVNDKTPTFETIDPVVHVRENLNIGTDIYKIVATDADTGAGGEIIYTIVNDDYIDTFDLDADDGVLTTVISLDREITSLYKLVIQANDKGVPAKTGTATVTVIVDDINDNAPSFDNNTFDVVVDRYANPQTYIMTITAVDADMGKNREVEYYIPTAYEKILKIDPKYGHILTSIDFHSDTNYIRLPVLAKDRGTPALSSSAILTITLSPPKISTIEDFLFNVSEYAAPNTFIGAIPTPASNYTIVSGNFKGNFIINERDGSIRLKNVLDREEYPDYYLSVRIVSKISYDQKIDVYVHIKVTDENDNAPTFEKQQYSLDVLEHTPVGYKLMALRVSDKDNGDNGRVTLSISDNGTGGRSAFIVDSNGVIALRAPITFPARSRLNLTVLASDHGRLVRTASAIVTINIIGTTDVCQFRERRLRQSNVISFEVPVNSASNYQIGCLTPEMFGVNKTFNALQYITGANEKYIDIDVETGCILLKDNMQLWTRPFILEWVVASTMTRTGEYGGVALLRIDTFVPNEHVVVLTHSIPREILELNRQILLTRLQALFPNNYVRIWKIGDSQNTFRRKLLLTGSQSYIYVIKENRTLFVSGVKTEKQYIQQQELLNVLNSPEGGVAQELTSEDFDTFPVNYVEPYKSSGEFDKPWVRSYPGKIVIGLALAFLIVGIVMTVVICDLKKKKALRKTTDEEPPNLNVPPRATSIEPKYNNLRRSSSSPDLMPLMNALKILSNMSEKDRNKLIQETLRSKRTENFPKPKFNLTKMKTLPIMNVTNVDEVNVPRKVSNEDAEDINTFSKRNRHESKYSTRSSKGSMSSVAPEIEYSVNMNDSSESTSTPIQQLVFAKPVQCGAPGSNSLSSVSIDSDTEDQHDPDSGDDIIQIKRSTAQRANGPIIVGGKEYDGVGKDMETGGKYLYNTQTGDKIHVTDDILKRAIGQRQSVVNTDFHKDNRGAKISTFKSPPMKRKTSRTRFSTTTIWEMSVTPDKSQPNEHGINVDDVDEGHDRKTSTGRMRRIGIANDVQGVPSSNTENKQRKISGEPDCLELSSDTESVKQEQGNVSTSVSLQDSNGNNSDVVDEDNALRRQYSANKNWNKVLTKAAKVYKNGNPLNKERFNDTDGSGSDTEHETGKWTKAKKVVRFVRPVYKPLNLDKVTCKVPKGKSDPKDCLSKDPVYVGWAKLVGRRLKTKTVKKKDGGDQTVTVREGRSLPANLAHVTAPLDVVALTKTVSNQLPPHLRNKRMSIDFQTF